MTKSKKRSRAGSAAAPRAAELFLASQAKEDMAWWHKQNPRVFARIESLIDEIRRSPFQGRGKPEPLPLWAPSHERGVAPIVRRSSSAAPCNS